MKKIVLIDFSNNLSQALQDCMISIGNPLSIEQNIREICLADGIILYGKGSFSECIEKIHSLGFEELIPQFEMPVLGVSLGMQILGTYCIEKYGSEHSTEGLSVFPIKVNQFQNVANIQHTSLESISELRGPLFKGIEENAKVFFDHSTKMPPSKNFSTSLCTFNESFSSSIQKDSFNGIEFFPELSGETGIKVLQNFIKLL